jgi:anti-sigma factor RsiW
MECAEMKIWLFRKIDGELSDLENAALDTHLAQCASCAREYRLLALPRRIAQKIPQPMPSPFFYQKLRMRIESEVQGTAGWQVLWGLARKMVPALAGITLALLSVLAYLQMQSPEADLYRAYESVFITEEQPYGMLVAGQGSITAESVLAAIAERESNHRHQNGK